MNVSPTIPSALAGGYASLLSGAKAPGDAAAPAGTASQTSSAPSGQSNPAVDAQKKLVAIQKGMVALMLIRDPVARAKAAAQMYKAFASVAKEYAAATAGGRAAAQKQSQANQQANAQTLANQLGANPAETAQAAEPDGGATPTDPTTPDAAAAQPLVLTAPPGAAAPAFVPDLIMEQIKIFANAAKQVYDLAVQEAKRKGGDHSKLKGADDEMKDAKDVLDAAAKDVEGDPDGVSAGYDGVGGGMAAPAPPVFQATA